MKSKEHDLDSDEWFLKPRASDEMELTNSSFKAFGRLLILKFKVAAGDEEDLNHEAESFSPKS